jgi:tetratricopeptide (TPR) repeat protein
VRAFLEAAGYQHDARTKALANALHAETNGNPLLIVELLAHLAETGVAYQADGFWLTDVWEPSDLRLPASARAVLQSRLDRVSDNANRLLEISAVIGRDFPYWLVAQVASRGQPTGEDELLDALDEAIDAGLVLDHGDGTYAFANALMRQTILARLTSARRSRLHLRAAEALSRMTEEPLDESMRLGLLAYHYRQAGPSSLGHAARYARAAAERAVGQLAFEDAAAYYEQAVEATPDLPSEAERRIELFLLMGECYWRSGQFGAADVASRRAHDLAAAQGLTDLEARATLALGGRGGHRFAVADDSLVDLLEQVRRREPPPSPALLALITARLAEALTLEPDEHVYETATVVAREAITHARETSDDSTVASVLFRTTYAQWTPDNPDHRLEALAETITLASRIDDADLNVSARILRYATLEELARTADALEEWSEASDIAGERGDAYSAWLVATVQASRHVCMLAPDEAEQVVWDALALGRRAHNPSALQLFGTQMFVLRREQARLHELHAATVAMVDRHPDLAFSRAVLAMLYAELGIRARAQRELDELAGPTRDFRQVPRDVLWLGTATLLAETCAWLEDRELAAPLYQQLRPYSDRLAPLGLHGPHLGSVAHHAGMLAALLAHADDAREHLLGAIEINDQIGAPAAAARSRLSLARLFMRHEAPHADDLIARVLSDSQRLGLIRIASNARELIDDDQLAATNLRASDTRITQARQTLDYGRAAITSRGRTIMGRILTRATDEELQRRFGTQRAQRALFLGMTRAFQPTMAFGFEGDITFELLNSLGIEGQPRTSWWTVSIRGRKATARSGAAETPAASIRLNIPDFIKMLSGAENAVAIFEQGRIDMLGDVLVIARLSEMFGGTTPLPTPR